MAKTLSPFLGLFSNSHSRHNKDLIDYLKYIVPGKVIPFDAASLVTNVPLDVTLKFLKSKLSTGTFDK